MNKQEKMLLKIYKYSMLNRILILNNLQNHKFFSTISSVLVTDSRREKFFALLENFGFSAGQIGRIFHSPHSILSLQEESLMSNLTNWLNFEVNYKLFTTLSAYPELLTLNPDYVNNRSKELMGLFTKKDINKILVTAPNVYLDEFQETFAKVQYIVTRMGVEQKSIVKSRALQFTLHHIHCRHNFMIRAGRYFSSKRSVKSKNAPLNKIFSRNMETFLKLTGLTEEEYDVFCSYFEDEINLDLDEEEEEHFEEGFFAEKSL